jgi:hypothetical protein
VSSPRPVAVADQHRQPGANDAVAAAVDLLRVGDFPYPVLATLLSEFDLTLDIVPDGAAIPGSYWGEPEAGLIGTTVHARRDTPLHSLLHEACHLVVLPRDRRSGVHTDATDSIAEEDATCYLQILLSDRIPGAGRERLMSDMDAWGYSFRLGSTRAWFENDADDARTWLAARGLLPAW